jgi:hypothetical protein
MIAMEEEGLRRDRLSAGAQCWPADANLQGNEEDGCGKDEAAQDRGRCNVYRWGSNVYRWGLGQDDLRRADSARSIPPVPARAWPRVLLVFDRDVVILHG